MTGVQTCALPILYSCFLIGIVINRRFKEHANKSLTDYIIVFVLIVFEKIEVIYMYKYLILPEGINAKIFLKQSIVLPFSEFIYLPVPAYCAGTERE